jgi:hypothetical protein
MHIHNAYDKTNCRMVLQETRAVGTLNGQIFIMEMLQELAPAGQ